MPPQTMINVNKPPHDGLLEDCFLSAWRSSYTLLHVSVFLVYARRSTEETALLVTDCRDMMVL